MTSRGRVGGKPDIESLERENDQGIESLAERVGLLKAATQNIKGEVDSQHNLLDGMVAGMGSTRGMLGSVNDKFRSVLNDKQGRKTVIAGAVILGLFVLWMLLRSR